MNTTLPPPRELPPGAHDRIRARIAGEAGKAHRPSWLVPSLAGAAALVLVAIFAWPVPGHHGSRPADPELPGIISTAPPAPGEHPRPDPAGVTADERAQIEAECGGPADTRDLMLYQVGADAAGRYALLYTPDGGVLVCSPGERTFPGDTTVEPWPPLDWLPGTLSIDVVQVIDQGSLDSGDVYPLRAGLQLVAGRVTSEVARVTFTVDGVTREAVLGDGTYVARILHPRTWHPRDLSQRGVMRAYDADGKLITTVDIARYLDGPCGLIPGGMVIPFGTAADRGHCTPAVPWR
jgi:hypothetical protein